MCEIFGVLAREKIYLNDYLKEFYRHCVEHPHGWGLARMDGTESVIEKEPVSANKSQYLKQRLSMPIREKTAFAHIRYATIGNVDYKNCHPFSLKDDTGRRWTLNHNGTIFDYPPIAKYVATQTGDTDSERILMHIVDQINRGIAEGSRKWTKEERFQFLDDLVCGLSKGNKLNFLLYDSEVMYVHTNYQSSLFYRESRDGTIFSTQPLGRDKESWKPVPFTTLLAFEDGRMTRVGTNHGNEYIVNEEDMKYIYQIFANL